jgi:P pilus assembly chaperone PapD
MKQFFILAVLFGLLGSAAQAQATVKLGETKAEFREKAQAVETRKENKMERKEDVKEKRIENREQQLE